jgi:hypothetical protein
MPRTPEIDESELLEKRKKEAIANAAREDPNNERQH